MRKVLFLFGQLNDDDVEWMLTAGTKRFVPAGGVVIEQGVPADALFILLEGKLAVWLRPRRGAERQLATLNAGEIVGEMSFVDARPPSATVKALDDSTVFSLAKPRLNRQARRRLRLRRPLLPRPRHLPLDHRERTPPRPCPRRRRR